MNLYRSLRHSCGCRLRRESSGPRLELAKSDPVCLGVIGMAEEAETSGRTASRERNGGDGKRREQKVSSAPSLGPNTVIEREPVEERLARHEQSEVDAMGMDKRRQVVGRGYGPSRARQLLLYGAFLLAAAALVVGGIFLVGSLDTGVGKHVPNSAPWSKPGVKQIKPKPIQ